MIHGVSIHFVADCSYSLPSRNDWPLARVTRAQVDSDGMMRRVDLVTVRGGSRRHYKRQRTNESN